MLGQLGALQNQIGIYLRHYADEFAVNAPPLPRGQRANLGAMYACNVLRHLGAGPTWIGRLLGIRRSAVDLHLRRSRVYDANLRDPAWRSWPAAGESLAAYARRSRRLSTT